MNIKNIFSLGVFLAATLSLPAQNATNTPPPNPRRPSLILIVADGLGSGDLGCYGQRRIKTPNFDRLAAEGVRFTSFYAGSPDAAISRAALLLGRDAGHLEIAAGQPATLPPGAPTLAEILSAAGYRTCCLGEWGLGAEGTANVPQKRGFHEWAGLLNAAPTDYPESISRFDPPGDGKPGYDGAMVLSRNEHGVKGQSASDLFTSAALNFIRYSQPDQFNRHRPFFLQINYALPRVHDLDSCEPYELEGWPKAEKFRAAAIARLDANLGKILDRLAELKQESNTIVIVTSAAGRRQEGGELRESSLRVPLLVWGPGKIKAGEENYLPAAAWDILPTLAEIGRAQLPEKIDGISFLPPLQGRPQLSRHDFLYWETSATNGLRQAVRAEDWKAVRFAPGAPLELYSLTADPAEKTSLAADHPELVAKMEAYLKTGRNRVQK